MSSIDSPVCVHQWPLLHPKFCPECDRDLFRCKHYWPVNVPEPCPYCFGERMAVIAWRIAKAIGNARNRWAGLIGPPIFIIGALAAYFVPA